MKKILVVDDDSHILAMLEKRLSSNGFEIFCATNGQEAVEKVRTHSPDLVVLDLMMPILDGTEAACILRENNATKDIPVIYLTALKSRDDDMIEMTSERSVVMAKPFDSEELIEKIKGLLPKEE